jgi:hypothetical protein
MAGSAAPTPWSSVRSATASFGGVKQELDGADRGGRAVFGDTMIDDFPADWTNSRSGSSRGSGRSGKRSAGA